MDAKDIPPIENASNDHIPIENESNDYIPIENKSSDFTPIVNLSSMEIVDGTFDFATDLDNCILPLCWNTSPV
jgi:hypothetical protein